MSAFISCPTNTSCNAECFRGFILPTGKTNNSFSRQKVVWTPVLSACKGKLFYLKNTKNQTLFVHAFEMRYDIPNDKCISCLELKIQNH